MKAHKPLLITLMVLTSIIASASSDSTLVKTKVEHQVFVNGTFFIKQLVSLSNANLTISPYIIGYKCLFNQKHALRFSLGGNYAASKQTPDSTLVKINKSGSVDYRLGYEYQHRFGKRWAIFAGADVINSYTISSSRANTDFDIVTTGSTAWSIGGGPVLGIQLNVHKNIALFTECALYYNYSETRTKTASANFPILNLNKVTAYDQKAQFVLPTSIYITFKF